MLCIDVDAAKIERLKRSVIHSRAGPDRLIERNAAAGRLKFLDQL